MRIFPHFSHHFPFNSNESTSKLQCWFSLPTHTVPCRFRRIYENDHWAFVLYRFGGFDTQNGYQFPKCCLLTLLPDQRTSGREQGREKCESKKKNTHTEINNRAESGRQNSKNRQIATEFADIREVRAQWEFRNRSEGRKSYYRSFHSTNNRKLVFPLHLSLCLSLAHLFACHTHRIFRLDTWTHRIILVYCRAFSPST